MMTVIFLLLVPCLGFSDMITFKAGYFIPRFQSDLWEVEFENMDFTKTDYYNTNFGFSYEYFLTRELSFALNVDSYSRKKLGLYKDFVGETIDSLDYAFDYGEGFVINHVFNVSITPIQLSVKLAPAGRKGRFIPYLGGGVGIYFWNVRLQGYIINFSPEAEEEFYDPNIDEYVIGFPIESVYLSEDNKVKVGFHALVGVMFPVANRISVEAEFKYNFAQGELGKDPYQGFQGFEPFDLSGYQFSIGLNYWF